jgi:flagellar basal-body rod protein FlgB
VSEKVLNLNASTLPGLDRLAQHLGYHVARQSVVAGNLANLDTPGFRARDLSFEEVLTTSRETGESTMTFERAVDTADDEVPDEDGNTVALETQIARMDETNIRFRAVAEVLSRRIGMLRYAAGDSRG